MWVLPFIKSLILLLLTFIVFLSSFLSSSLVHFESTLVKEYLNIIFVSRLWSRISLNRSVWTSFTIGLLLQYFSRKFIRIIHVRYLEFLLYFFLIRLQFLLNQVVNILWSNRNNTPTFFISTSCNIVINSSPILR